MKRLIGSVTLGVSLLGAAVGLGSVLLSPTTGITGDDVKKVTEERVCVSGCDPETDFCCIEGKE